jgi:hypothetical protein
VYEVTSPRSHKTKRTTAIVYNIVSILSINISAFRFYIKVIRQVRLFNRAKG